MKRLLLLSVVLLMIVFVAGSTQAQTPISIGLKAGLNLANVSFSPEVTTLSVEGAGDVPVTKSMRTGFGVGGVVEIGIANQIAIQVEPMYLQQGVKFEGSAQGQSGTATIKADYIAVPILAKVKFDAGQVKPFVFAGPNIGFLMSAKETLEAAGQTQDNDIKDGTESINFSIDFGAGAAFDLSPTMTLGVDARYSLGLSNLMKDSGTATAKTNGIGIFATALFKL